MPRLCSSLLLSLWIASPAPAVTMAWTPIGNPGNTCETLPDTGNGGGCFGGVGYSYAISTYEVTNAQYAEFLNAKAKADPLDLYHLNMGSAGLGFYGGITRSGSSGSYSYSPIAGRENMPVNHVSFYDSLRFANWMNNGQGNASTESGAYTLLGGTSTPSNGNAVTRTAGATIVLPSENEWYKAAYYDASSSSYFDYPAGTNTPTTCSVPTGAANSANCGGVAGDDFVNVGSYPGSPSPYGSFDQGGNAWEWNEALIAGSSRGVRGAGFGYDSSGMAVTFRNSGDPTFGISDRGFRLAMIPEPSTGLLMIAGLVGLAGWRKVRG